MRNLIFQILASILGIYLASRHISGVEIAVFETSEFFGFRITALWQVLIVIGAILGLINFFIKPILRVVTLPLHFLTLGLSSVLINLGVVWVVSLIFEELTFTGFTPLFLTTLLISILNLIFTIF